MGNELQKTSSAAVIMTQIRSQAFENAYTATLPVSLKGKMTIEKAINIVGRAAQKNPKLLKCSVKTIQQSLIDAAALGLELSGPLHQAAIVPYWNRRANQYDAQMQIEFQGYLELMSRTGKYDGPPTVQWVYEQDAFKLDLGGPLLSHEPCLHGGDRGEPYVVYMMVRAKGSTYPHVHYMTMEQIIDHRERYVKKDRNGNWPGPWDDVKNYPQFLEMGKKTVIRLAQKHLPKSSELATAVQYESVRESGGYESIVEFAAPKVTEERPDISRTEEIKLQLAEESEAPATDDMAPDVDSLHDMAISRGMPEVDFEAMVMDCEMTSDRRTHTDYRISVLADKLQKYLD